MSRVIPRFDVLAAARFSPATDINGKHKRIDLAEVFGENVFGLHQMKARLPKPQYRALLSTIQNGTELDSTVADSVAIAMKEWAL